MSLEIQSLLEHASTDALVVQFARDSFNEVFPGFQNLIGCTQGKYFHLEGDVASHTALVIKNMRAVSRELFMRAPTYVELLSALLHDRAKLDTRIEYEDGSVKFPNHEKLSSKYAAKIAPKLELPNAEVQKLVWIIARHGEAHEMPKLTPEDVSQIRSSPHRESLALLQVADARSCYLPGGKTLPEFADEILRS